MTSSASVAPRKLVDALGPTAPGLLFVVSAFLASRALHDSLSGGFRVVTLSYYWQFIDPALLRNDLLRSLVYLHGQLPLMNLFTGVVLQLFPETHETAFHALYFAMGLALACGLYLLGLQLRFPAWLSALVATWIIVNPTTIAYEHWLTYTYPMTAALALSGAFLHRFARDGKTLWGVLFFSLLTGLALTWSLFHLVWLLGVVAMLFAIVPGRRRTLLIASLPIALVFAWYAKNYVIFGLATPSSWSGMNLSRVSTFRLADGERERLFDRMRSPFAWIPPFSDAATYLALLPGTPKTGIPLLDAPATSHGRNNYHHLVYVAAGRRYLDDALRTISRRPGTYLRSVLQSASIYFNPPSEPDWSPADRSFPRWSNRLFYGQGDAGVTFAKRVADISTGHVGWLSVAAFIAAMAGSAVFLWRHQRRLAEPAHLLVLFLAYNVAFVTLAGTLLEFGENNRFRFVVDPLVLLLAVFALRPLIKPLCRLCGVPERRRR